MIKEGLIKEICQKSPDEPLKEDLLTTILKAHIKVRKKAKKKKSQKRKFNFKWQLQTGDQVLRVSQSRMLVDALLGSYRGRMRVHL
jgi:hypothetical protein